MHNNIKPCWWGSNLWQTIYTMVAVYPENPNHKEIEAIKMFFTSLQHLIPCENCRLSYCGYTQESNTDINKISNFNSRNNLINFVYILREKVNNKLNNEYGISLIYFKKKLDKMICTDDNRDDGYINNMIEVPFIQKNIEKIILNYLKKKTTYNPTYTQEILEISKNFMLNPNFNYNDKYFRLIYKRHSKCRKIINKIYQKMSEGDYDMIKSFQIDKDLHHKLFFLGSNIIHSSDLVKLLS